CPAGARTSPAGCSPAGGPRAAGHGNTRPSGGPAAPASPASGSGGRREASARPLAIIPDEDSISPYRLVDVEERTVHADDCCNAGVDFPAAHLVVLDDGWPGAGVLHRCISAMAFEPLISGVSELPFDHGAVELVRGRDHPLRDVARPLDHPARPAHRPRLDFAAVVVRVESGLDHVPFLEARLQDG